MADIADEAADLQAQEIALALSAPKPPSLPAIGRCHYCEAALAGTARFCDEDCAHDWEEEQRLLRIRGGRNTRRFAAVPA